MIPSPEQLRLIICGLIDKTDSLGVESSPDDDFRHIAGNTLVFVPNFFINSRAWADRDAAMYAIIDLLAHAGITADCAPLEDSKTCFTVVVTDMPDDYEIPEIEASFEDLKEYTGDDPDDKEEEDPEADSPDCCD